MNGKHATLVYIHYLRPPGREQIFTQHLIWEDREVKVTYADDLVLESPVRIAGEIVLETGSEVVWFTFPGAWHDIGIFHRADGSFSGTYANILTPCSFEDAGIWRTTDLFLDIWIDPSGRLLTLDEDELGEAEMNGWVAPDLGRRARDEARMLVEQAEAGWWPPAVVGEWTLERARAQLS
ncbi:MAG: DUF402 domain-containing protein [Gemmatimonadota bacterium]|nr:DUF402 domain-containing protein [Gemmatimonadota bacterium]